MCYVKPERKSENDMSRKGKKSKNEIFLVREVHSAYFHLQQVASAGVRVV